MASEDKPTGLVESAKEVLGGEERREDKDELTSTDFSKAATNLQEKVAGAMQYVSESLTPSSDSTQGGAENDPEVKEFRKSAAEAVDGAKEAVAPNKGTGAQQESLSSKAAGATEAAKEKVMPTAKAAGPDTAEEKADSAVQSAIDNLSAGAQYVADRFTAPATGDKDGKPPAQEKAEQKSEEASQSVSSAAQGAKDSVVSGATYVKDRFTAPATGDKDGKPPAQEKAEQKTEEASQSASSALKDLQDKVSGGASYVAGRFTADPSGDSGKTEAKAEEAKEKTGGFLSGLLPKSNEGEETSTGGKSLGDKAADKYDSLKAEANKTQDSIADQITPKNQEEADLSAGMIPSSTAEQK